ncbi:heavy-metal-associated domain-containing protein [Sphingomonas sp.]|uniref:heavy-metal-associated domain-containing protein n=1 Tax=Sphingomonas sp. TaxID=28214 RepID=UPI002CA13A72|nr:heavy-metal-associated domain-containing protein [Sphingomonas sp.]HWK34824.1 heavy-metal-associated domain-containing protein [Sphingomonas sp.]
MQLHVENMTCGSCVRHVTRAIEAVDPQATVEVDIAGKKVTVDTCVGAHAIEAALAADGYPARAIEAA